jgi:hypothetical protein
MLPKIKPSMGTFGLLAKMLGFQISIRRTEKNAFGLPSKYKLLTVCMPIGYLVSKQNY